MSTQRAEFEQFDGNMLVFSGIPTVFCHAVFNRHGGTSPAPWNSNNVSFGIGDAPRNVSNNRNQIKIRLGIRRLISAKQVHGSRVYVADQEPENDIEVAGYDALVTNVPGIGLMIQQADCQAVFLFDPVTKSVGVAHAGWRGSVADIIGATVSAMRVAFATEPGDIIAALSPSLGPCCAEFINYRHELPVALHGYQVRPTYFDFWAISRDQLCATGIQQENIQVAAICTRCNPDYFSYRRDKETGRFASVAGVL